MSASADYANLLAAVRERRPRLAFVFGSGLGVLDEHLQNACQAPFLEVPGLSGTTVPGHKGSLRLGEWAGVAVLVFSGRLHYYEGHPWRSVVQPVRIAHDLGVRTLIVTNAAGGIRDDLVPGTLMALTDHLQLTKPSWWREPPNVAAFARMRGATSGPRVLANAATIVGDATASPYDGPLRKQMAGAAHSLGFELHEGVYAQVTGPCYETKAEIRALRICGADAVGMSTAREVETAAALGMRCAAISCITNRAAGLNAGPIHHDEVLDVVVQVRERLARFLEEFLKQFAQGGTP